MAAKEIVEAIPFPVAMTNADGSIVGLNHAFTDALGYAESALPDFTRLLHLCCTDPATRLAVERLWRTGLANDARPGAVVADITCANGTVKVMQLSMQHLSKQAFATQIIIFEDITERKQAEAKVLRLTGLYRAHSLVNQAIIRLEDESTLFPLVCRIAVELGGMTLAGIRQINPDTQCLEPVVSYGNGADFLEKIVISIDERVPEGRGPAGISFRDSKVVITNDYINDPMTRPWQDEARRYGWGSSGTFPILRGGRPYAGMGVYHKSIGAFDDQTIELLLELTRDIGFALDSFDRDRERREARAELQASERHFRAYFDYAMVGMLASSVSTGALLEVNEAMCNMLGYSAQELMQMTWADITHPDDMEESRNVVESVKRGDATDFEIDKRYLKKDGSVVHAHVASRVVLNERGQVDYMVTIVDDMTEIKIHQNVLERLVRALSESQEQLQQLNRSLEAQVKERTHHLAEANSSLETTLRNLEIAQNELVMSEKLASLGSLVAGISHELNTPIGNVLMVVSALDSLLDKLLRQVESGQVRKTEAATLLRNGLDMARVATRSITRAADLIQSFKQVAVDQTSEHRREFDLKVVIDDVVSTFAIGSKIKLTRIEIVNDVPAGILCNSYPGPFGQVLINLVQNAVIHAFDQAAAGQIELSGINHGDSVDVSVKDNGCGMVPDVTAHVFDPFFTTRLGQGGSGLGLAISYNIVTSVLGGRFTVKSSPGHGSTFTLSFPKVAPLSQN